MGPKRTKFCDLCQQDLKLCGWTTHCKACEKKAKKQRQNQLVAESIQRKDSNAAGGQHNISPTWNEVDDNMGHIVYFLTGEVHISDTASHRITGFTKDIISAPYDGTIQEFDLHCWNLWEWATDLLRDPRLFPHMRFSKFNGETFMNFVDEPYTAEAFWNAQSQLPEGAKPLAFIL
ncbi:hypothetical protein BDR07DRAFT_1378517, partial [Suillus spraguei]